ncbi:MAG: TatD family hydrolase, partial [Lachnospiraceae bacterium]|nr:TatD family hydrolase [Lachnospiraceae bacterium]
DGTERMTDDPEENFAELRKMASMEKVISIGEIGLDYHWNVYPREVQKEAFVKQWELAVELGLPIEIHSRDAAEDTMNIVREMYAREKAAGRALRADMHCYSYSPEQAEEYLKMGLYFGIGGVLTFKNAKKLREVVDLVPVEKLLLETDCPYLAPEPHRGQRNNSAYLHSVVAEIARIKGLTGEEVEDITYANACRFFNLQV